MTLIYISISGNTRSFVQRLQTYASTQQAQNPALPLVELKEIHDNSSLQAETTPFFAFVPTYLEGGNGVETGEQEILTESLYDYLAFKENARYCLGVIGSGNKNFNRQYCLTAKQYAAKLGFPFLDDYELRGTQADLQRIYQLLVQKNGEITENNFPQKE
ncbi:MAG: class Ib ribonucleoside-diphosphate reductase assembly flavoprotein NrdI [Enterococcus sp.]